MASFDLNLLTVFDALLEEGSVTGAAARLNLSVPATSRALGRLRRAVGDPVLVRAGRGLVPTPYALQAATRLRAVLEAADELLTPERDLDPATLRRIFTIRMNDGIALTLGDALTPALHTSAPAVTVRYVVEAEESVEPLRDGTLDLDIGVRSARLPDLYREVLYRECMAALVRVDSRLGQARRPTLRQLCAVPHIAVSRRGIAHGPLDSLLAERGLQRHVSVVVPWFSMAALLASGDDLVAFAPSRLARKYSEPLGLRVIKLPDELPTLDLTMVWHVRVDADPAQRWLRNQVRAAVTSD